MRCEYLVHIKCATSDPESFTTLWKGHMGDYSLIDLPMVDEQTSLVRYLLENTVRYSTEEQEADSIHAEKLFEGNHEHALIYHDDTSIKDDDHKYRLCNGCVRPISPPYYHCPQCKDFFLHSCCANLPCKFRRRVFQKRLTFDLHLKSGDHFFFPFKCYACTCYYNGFFYTSDAIKGKRVFLDVECTFMPESITHKAHSKTHILALTEYKTRHNSFEVVGSCPCCGLVLKSICYNCSSCRHFKLHARCAMFPETVTHKFDKHPLKRICTKSSSKLDDKCFCGICEKSINTKRWFYGCDECENWFHINCIPSVGTLSKFKFGGTIRVPCHDCPLTSVRLLTDYKHRCGICRDTIWGFDDEIAFECSKCDFRVHCDCAKEHQVI